MAFKSAGVVLTAGFFALGFFRAVPAVFAEDSAAVAASTGATPAHQAAPVAEQEGDGSPAGGFQGLFSDLLDFIHREFSFSTLLEPDGDEEKAAWERLEKYGPGSLAPQEKETLREYRKTLEKRAGAFETVISRAEKKTGDFFRQIKKSLKAQKEKKLKSLRRIK